MNQSVHVPISYPAQSSVPAIPPPPESRIGIVIGETLELRKVIGKGAYGIVYLAVDTITNDQYAVKALSKITYNGQPLSDQQLMHQLREIEIHTLVSAHPNVVTVHRIVDLLECTYVVLEYCGGGDLFTNITEHGRFVGNDDLIRDVFCQILSAVEYCHTNGIYHRDLKPENILVSDNGKKILLADFGLATSDIATNDHGCGSTFYMSPECLDPIENLTYYCGPNDIWSLGVTLLNLTCGRNPWIQASLHDSTYREFFFNPVFLQTILPLSDELNSIILRIFTLNPWERIDLGSLKTLVQKCKKFTSPVKNSLLRARTPGMDRIVYDAGKQVFWECQPVRTMDINHLSSPTSSTVDYSENTKGLAKTRKPLRQTNVLMATLMKPLDTSQEFKLKYHTNREISNAYKTAIPILYPGAYVESNTGLCYQNMLQPFQFGINPTSQINQGSSTYQMISPLQAHMAPNNAYDPNFWQDPLYQYTRKNSTCVIPNNQFPESSIAYPHRYYGQQQCPIYEEQSLKYCTGTAHDYPLIFEDFHHQNRPAPGVAF